uniref:Uncharacterized protein n=1 Tax=Triticum urartu TaxID=4572 RepID=A0A8R7PD86_TRIUA
CIRPVVRFRGKNTCARARELSSAPGARPDPIFLRRLAAPAGITGDHRHREQRRHGCPELCRQPRRVNPAGSSRPCPDPHPPLRRAPDSATTKPPIRRPSPARLGWTGEVSDLPL